MRFGRIQESEEVLSFSAKYWGEVDGCGLDGARTLVHAYCCSIYVWHQCEYTQHNNWSHEQCPCAWWEQQYLKNW